MSPPSRTPPKRGRVRLADLTATPIIALRTAPDLSQAIPLALDRVVPSPHNARREIPRDQAFIELKDSIRENGVLQPILVRPDGTGHMLIAGHRRLEAVRDLAVEAPDDPRWRKILAIQRDTDEQTAEALSLVENLQRQDLNPLEEAGAYVRLHETYGLTLGAVADLAHRSKMHVSRRVRLVSDPALRRAVSSGQLAVSSAERLLRAPQEARATLVQQAVVEKWTPDQAEEAVRNRGATSRVTADSPTAARRVGFTALVRRLRVDVPVLERGAQRLAKEEQAELAVWAQRLLMAVQLQP